MLFSFEELQPYFSAAGAILGFTTLGFVIRLLSTIRTADRAWGEAREEQAKLADRRATFLQEVSQEKEAKLTAENESLKLKLQETLSSSGVSIDSIIAGNAVGQIGSEISKKIDELVGQMEARDTQGGVILNAEWHLQIAKGHMARRRWPEAAKHFEFYTCINPKNFYAQLSRGIAYANVRGGEEANIQSLRAYNEAIAFLNEGVEAWLHSRLFIYRGAILKRLNRLDESEADLLIGKSRANTAYEIADVRYNLACIYAMKNDRHKLFETLEQLSGAQQQLQAINFHLDDYFSGFASDEEFMRLIKVN